MQTSSTNGNLVNNNSQRSGSHINSVDLTMFYAAGAAAVLTISACIGIWCLMRSRKHRQRRDTEPTNTHMTANNSISTAMSANPATSSIMGTHMATLNVTSHEISIPGFLRVEYGLDYSRGKTIATGGMGTIKLATAISAQLLKRAAGAKLVAKESDMPLSSMAKY